MSKKKNSSMLCFTPMKNDNKPDKMRTLSCINTTKSNISRSFHDYINYLDTGSIHSSNSSGKNGIIKRPKPPPYDEYTSKIHSNGLIRSFSTYSASNDQSFYNDSNIEKESCEDSFSQFSESDPPKLMDEMSRATISEHCVRPKSLRPSSPIVRKNSFNKGNIESQQSPSGDSGVRLTPSDLDPVKFKKQQHEYDVQRYLESSSYNRMDNIGYPDQLKLLQVVNNKLSLNDINNQHLINKATHFIDKLRQKLKDKNYEIIQLKNKLKEHSDRLKKKEILCQQLEIQLQQSCHLINTQAITNTNGNHSKEASTQTSVNPEDMINNRDYVILQKQFEEERSRWLDEKSQVISYHKQLNVKYQNLLEKNSKLEIELDILQKQLTFDPEISSDNDINEPSDFINSDLHGSLINNITNQSSSRLVKFEESLC